MLSDNYNKKKSKGHQGKKLVRRDFHVEYKVLMYKSWLIRWHGKWNSKASGSYILNKVFAYGLVEVKDSGDLKVFIMKGERLKICSWSEKALEKVSLMLREC